MRKIHRSVTLSLFIACITAVYITAKLDERISGREDEKNRQLLECMSKPTLTGEYGQPDGWETLTGPYVE